MSNDLINGSRNERDSVKRYTDKLVSQGLCVMCRQPNDKTTRRCSICTKKTVERNKQIKEKNLANHQCTMCGCDWKGATKMCPDCKEKANNKWKDKTKTLHCIRCSALKEDPNSSSCNKCKTELREYQGSRRDKLRKEGKCIQCTKLLSSESEYENENERCIECTLKHAAARWLEDKNRWQELLDLYNKQNGLCAYSDRKLVFGKNAEVDHIIPRARGGTNTIDNLQWLDADINFFKNSMTHDELVQVCKTILSKHTSM